MGPVSAIIVPMDKIRAGRNLMAAANPREVAMRLRAAMAVSGLTQSDVVRIFGFGSAQVSQWLTGRNRPSLENLLLMLPWLDVDANYILVGDYGTMSYAKRDALAAAHDNARAIIDARDAASDADASSA
jgi:transcriptional regulator with XRE-family HTH domain